jgi:hypothetical protein
MAAVAAVTRRKTRKAKAHAAHTGGLTPSRLAFKKAAEICKGQPLPNYRACMAKEIRRIYAELTGKTG